MDGTSVTEVARFFQTPQTDEELRDRSKLVVRLTAHVAETLGRPPDQVSLPDVFRLCHQSFNGRGDALTDEKLETDVRLYRETGVWPYEVAYQAALWLCGPEAVAERRQAMLA